MQRTHTERIDISENQQVRGLTSIKRVQQELDNLYKQAAKIQKNLANHDEDFIVREYIPWNANWINSGIGQVIRMDYKQGHERATIK